MALKVVDRVKETTTTTGTGTVNLAGAASGFRTFVAGVGDGNTTYYAITDANGTAWEVGLGTVTDASPDTLARTTLLASSTGSKISLSSGTHTVFATYPGSKAVFTDADGHIVPLSDDAVDLGTSSVEFRNAYFDGTVTSDAFAGPLTGDVTGNADTATTSTNITASANNSTDETVYPAFVDGATGTQGIETDTGLTYNPSTGTFTSTVFVGNLTGNVTGNTSGTAATVTGAAQSNITSLGTLTALTVDDVAIDGKVITMTGSTDDTAVFTVGTNGTLSIVTTDDGGASANIQITADGTVDIDSAGVLTLDSGAAINIEPASGSAILLDGTISIDAGVVTGATSITSTAFVGDITGDVTGNADTATLATSFTASANNSTDETVYPVFVDGATGTQGAETDTGFTYNPSSGLLTIAGELDAGSLDISGNADIDGTLEADAYTVDGVALNEYIADTVGAMVGSNTETNITVTYEDGDNTLDFVIGTLNQDTTGTADNITVSANNSTDETVYPIFVDGATGSQGAESDTGFTYNPSSGLLTISGELDAGSLDISGNADIDGTLEADAITVDGVALNEYIADTVGAMVGSNTETGIAVTYEDGDNTLDFVIGTLNQDTTGTADNFTVSANNSTDETVYPVFVDGATGSQGAETDTGFTYNPSSGLLTIAGELDAGSLDISGNADIDGTLEADAITVDGTTLAEYIADTVGAMVGSNTETGITVSYEDGDNTLDFVIGTLNQDTTGTAAIATTVTITDNESTNEDNAIIFTAGGDVDGGNLGLESDGTLTYNPSTGKITATGFIGALTGNADTATVATTVTITDNESTNEDNAIIFTAGGDVDGGNIGLESDGDLHYNPSTGTVTATIFKGNIDAVDGDFDGTLEADAITVGGSTLASVIAGTTVSNATTAAVATTVTITDNESTNEENAIIFTAGGDVDGGNIGLESDGTMTYNPSTGTITATIFKGNVDAVDGDFDGTLEADAYTVDGVALATYIRDTVGTNMLSSNTESGITVTYDTSNDNIDFAIDAAQTGITSLLAADIKIGEDDQTKIDFETADEIHFYAANVEQVYLADNIFGPQSDSDVDLGTTGVRWKDAFVDSITVTGEIDGDSLDIEGDADINGTLEADAITVGGTNIVTGGLISSLAATVISGLTEVTSADADYLLLWDADDSALKKVDAGEFRSSGGGSGDITGVTLAGDSGSAADTSGNADLTVAGGNGITTSGSSTTLTVALDAALTTVTSLLATDIKIGEDDQTKIDFETADEIHFYAANVEQVYLADNVFGPQSDSDVDLGTTGVRWKDAYIDTITTTGDVDVLGNIELGHASDTTIARASSGQITVEGTAVILAGAVTGITSLLATDIKIGEDDQTKIDFETADEIHFYANNVEQVYLADNVFGPQSDSDVDLGTTGVRWKDAYIDTITTTGDVDVLGNIELGHASDTTIARASSGQITVEGTAVILAGAVTGITSLLATDIKIGEDAQTAIDFETANEIHFDADNAERVKITSDGLYVDKIRRHSDSSTTTKILLNDEALKLYAGHSSNNICTIDSTGLTIDSGSLETATIDYTDGDLAMTIADGGGVTFAADVTFGVDDTGVDVRLYSATTNEGVLYDASADALALLLTTKLKFHDADGDEEIFASANGHLEVNAGTTLDMTAPTVDINASTGVTIDTDTVTIASANTTDPVMILKNTNTDANAPRLRFDKPVAGTDGDDLGIIEFYGEDSSDNAHVFAKILAEISESQHTDEAGKLSLFVAESDGTTTALTAGLVLEGEHATDGEVDVTIAAGASSTTTVAGNLTVVGTDVLLSAANSKVTFGDCAIHEDSTSGWLTLDATNIELDASNGAWYLTESNTERLSFKETNSGDITIQLTTDTKDLIFTDHGDAEGFRILDGAKGVSVVGDVRIAERADHAQTPGAGYGQLWVKNEAPCELYFTTDAGNDIQLTDGTSIAGGSGGGSGDVSAGSSFSTNGVIMAANGTSKTIDVPGTTLTTNDQPMTVSADAATPFIVDNSDRDGNISVKFQVGSDGGTNNQASLYVTAQSAANCSLYLGDNDSGTTKGGLKYKNNGDTMDIRAGGVAVMNIDGNKIVDFKKAGASKTENLNVTHNAMADDMMGTASIVVNLNADEWLEIKVNGNTRYIPVWS